MKDRNKNQSKLINKINQFLLNRDKQLLDGCMLPVIPVTEDQVIQELLFAVCNDENVPRA